MEILKDVLILLVSFVVIGKGAGWLVDAAARVAKHFGISELVIGLTIVALGTSAPEFGVTILAALRGMGDISVGNIVGSNIFNLGFILGGTAIIHNLKTSRIVIRRDGFFLLFGALLLSVFLWDLTLSRIEGVILFTLLVLYLIQLYVKKQPLETELPSHEMYWWDPVVLLLGLIMVLTGAHFLVESAVNLAEWVGVSNWVIGATIVAAGTSAPEFATSLAAALKSRYSMSVGNLIGSDIFNLFGVLGVAGILRDLPVGVEARVNLVILSMMVAIVLLFMRTGWVVSRKEGVILVLIGLLRWIYSFS
ncbi:MAG: calcium/sodium antiporter [Candidatus Marinimicrobia bacterium]|nr:calcium/sodium antiporter [Candidatus Neomarinimicrobiota bacterium]MDP6835640.1 calcium/sodium antiporter [Candidatus Neomarinimicrobiota bacterium]MDP6966875.1 calcium/sodium antiporter [Candidatus Neomarinimicrobiota bacterium]